MRSVGRIFGGFTAGVIVTLCCAGPALAMNLPDATLGSMSQVVSWRGESPDITGQGYGPPTQQSCTPSTCDSFLLNIQLPAGGLPKSAQHPAPPGTTRVQAEGPTDMPGDGVLVTIHW